MSAPKHLLRWKGRQSGPFAADEIRARLKASEIGLMHEVQMDGQWMTIEKFLIHTAPRPAAPQASRLERPPPVQPVKVPEIKPVTPPMIDPPRPLEPPHAFVPMVPVVPPIATTPAPLITHPLSASGLDEDDAPLETLAYGGFWLRYVALTIDAAILSAISWAVAASVVLGFAGGSRGSLPGWLVFVIAFFYTVGSWLYFALMESSEIQATLGKLAVGIIVTDLTGRRITFTHASGRFCAKLLSALTVGVGYFMAAFTARKQALHDLLAGCHVLLRLPPSRLFQP